MQFVDEGLQVQNAVPSLVDSVSRVGDMSDLMLGSWLERPLEIANYVWTTGTEFSEIFDPWTLFMTDPRNINKIAYYNNFSCDSLCVKFLINGGPFYYSKVLVSYLPFGTTTTSDVVDHMSFYATTAPDNDYTLTSHTHRPHIVLDPTLSQGGCFELPFLWYNNYLEIPKKEWTKMGTLSMQSFSPLLTAGGAAESSIKIKAFAWMNRPRLLAPTTSLPTLPAQSTAGDEYVGMVSKPASAVSRMAGSLRSIPIIGEYARATQIGAGAVASVAKLLGFSRPNILTPITPIRPTYGGELAIVDKPEYVCKITTDSKQELSISPSNFGVGGEDPFSISGLVGKEVFLGKSVWDIDSLEGYNLFSSLVTPMLYKVRAVAGVGDSMVSTAMSYGSLPFRYWKGNIKFRFQLVASQYHRGRVKVVYDIAEAPISTKSNSLYARIVDIQETTDFTVTIGWNNPKLMCEVHNSLPLVFNENWSANGLAFTPDMDYHNGSLSMFIENELKVPIPGVVAPAYWLVWVSMENPVFNEPCSSLQQITPSVPFTATAGEEADDTSSLIVGDVSVDTNLNQVVFGETITSYRALLKRYCNYVLFTRAGLSTTVYSTLQAFLRDFPLFPGSDANGIHATALEQPTNFVGMTFVNYLAMAHSCYRGGIKYKFVNSTASFTTTLTFSRENTEHESSDLIATALAAANAGFQYASGFNQLANAWQGKAITVGSRNPFLEAEAPFWYNKRFLNPKYFSDNTYAGNCALFSISPYSGNTTSNVVVYVAAAEDFQLAMYTGPPVLWLSDYNVY